ncbi:serine/threonine-protein kinase [Streptomyces sp. B6B3]|uniref:serine/threonine-protein kinase n=1 Tax=Streptomyces sp. B6B3 TaxID=3153570 RepID=UPI00325E4FCA
MRPLRPEDPQALGQYRLLRALGAGGMGRVYLGRSAQGRMVAVKLIHQEFAAEPDFRRRFEREVEAARRVGGDWTAPVLDADTTAEIPWVATGYVPGPPLQQVVDELYGPLPEPTVWRLAEGLARALKAVHASGLVHRDLKPSNVMVTVEGPRVIDFGIARAADSSVVTRTGAVIGSPGFMSPEQVRGERLDAASDVFSLGTVLAFTVNGGGPFDTENGAAHSLMYRVVAEEPDLGRLSGPLRDLVARCLAKEPGDRPTPDEIAELAARHAGGGGPWLPPELTDRLARDAAALLALEGPMPTQLTAPLPATPAPFPATPAPFPAASGHSAMPTVTASPGTATPPPGSSRRGRSTVLAAVVGAVVTAVALLTLIPLLGGDGDDAGQAASGETAGQGDGASSGPTGPSGDAAEPSTEPSRDQPPTGDESASEDPDPGGYDFTGSWQGSAIQNNVEWDIAAEYTGGDIGDEVATVSYPSLDCAGSWRLEQQTAEAVTVYERISQGDCPDTSITLTVVDDFTLHYLAEGPVMSTDGEGELKRQ